MRYLIRFAIWVPILLLIIAARWWWFPVADEGAVGGERMVTMADVPMRPASVAEWSRDIADLGEQALAKRLVWQPLRRDRRPQARGVLIWWHDGHDERIGYLPHPDEDDAVVAAMSLMRALIAGDAVLYQVHGDPELGERLQDISANFAVPPGVTVLKPPVQP
ncbi:MAG: hypothetical protein EA401_04890 [Planctomycetota bacterium]|nr:MAG: hypothetical protein EA401_04890 [Planctomycetota bacterium]